MRLLAQTTAARSPSLPELATAHEQGLTDLEAETWSGFFLPKGTPDAIVRRLNAATITTLQTPVVQRRLGEVGAFVVAPEQQTPEYLQAFVVREIARWSAAITAAGITVE